MLEYLTKYTVSSYCLSIFFQQIRGSVYIQANKRRWVRTCPKWKLLRDRKVQRWLVQRLFCVDSEKRSLPWKLCSSSQVCWQLLEQTTFTTKSLFASRLTVVTKNDKTVQVSPLILNLSSVCVCTSTGMSSVLDWSWLAHKLQNKTLKWRTWDKTLLQCTCQMEIILLVC